MKTRDLYKLEDVVKDVLTRFEETRSDDFKLIYAVYRELNFFHTTRELFCEIMMNHNKYKLPSFASVTRSRRKLAKKYPELRPVKKVQKTRNKTEDEYINYAIDGYKPTFKKLVNSKK